MQLKNKFCASKQVGSYHFESALCCNCCLCGLQIIVELLQKEQRMWTTSLEADQQELARETDEIRMKIILKFRVEKKNVLLKCLNLCQQKAGSKPRKHSDRAFAKST